MANLGVPVKLLHESLGHVITVELKTGEVSQGLQENLLTGLMLEMCVQMYRGKLMEGACLLLPWKPSNLRLTLDLPSRSGIACAPINTT